MKKKSKAPARYESGQVRLQATREALRRRREGYGPVMRLPDVRKKLNGVNEETLMAMIKRHGMPEPVVIRDATGDPLTETKVWNSEAWFNWFWRYIRRSAGIFGKNNAGNISNEAIHLPDCRENSREWIHGLAAEQGRTLTHMLTISFEGEYGPDTDEKVIRKINHLEKAEVGKWAKKLPTKVWRRFANVDAAPRDMFFFCIWPENHSRYGRETRWHYHVELFLTEAETGLLERNFPLIKRGIRVSLKKLANGRKVSVHLRRADPFYDGYCQKDAHNNLDMIECNFCRRA